MMDFREYKQNLRPENKTYKCYERIVLALKATKYLRVAKDDNNINSIDKAYKTFLETNGLTHYREYCIINEHKNCFCENLSYIDEETYELNTKVELSSHEFTYNQIQQIAQITKIDESYFLYDFSFDQKCNSICLYNIFASIYSNNPNISKSSIEIDLASLFNTFTLMLYLNQSLDNLSLEQARPVEIDESLQGNPFSLAKELAYHGVSIRQVLDNFYKNRQDVENL